jgi:proteasome component ECM29
MSISWYAHTDLCIARFSAEQDESASVSVSLDKVLNCAAASITIALPQDIIHHKKNILEVLLNSLSPEEGWQGMFFYAGFVI